MVHMALFVEAHVRGSADERAVADDRRVLGGCRIVTVVVVDPFQEVAPGLAASRPYAFAVGART